MPRRRKDRIDDNQNDIVKELRRIPGLTVEPDHDDVLIGWMGKTYWFEIKNPEVKKKCGGYRKGAIKPHQQNLKETWTGHYEIVSTIEEILHSLGINKVG